MKINDILNEDNLDEAPASALGQIGRKIGAKVAGKLGMKGVAGTMATKANVGDEANRVKRELNQYMAGSGIKKNELELNDLVNFLTKSGFDKNSVVQTVRKIVPKQPPAPKPAAPKPSADTLTAGLDNNVTEAVDPQVIDKVIMSLVQQGFKKQAPGQQQRSKYATDTKQPGAAASAPAAGNNKAVAQAMSKFKSATGIKNPAIAAKALQKAGAGEVLAPNERKEIAPLLNKLAQSMNDSGGQQRILQLFRQVK